MASEPEAQVAPSPAKRRRPLLVALVVLAGLLVAFALLQVVTWPDVAALKTTNPRSTAFIDRHVAREKRAGRTPRLQWTWAPYGRISPALKRAVLVSEDINFFSHNGFDVGEMKKVLREALEERELGRGASTLTQQLAKNLWLSPSRSPLRKVKEALLTRALERHLDKRRIFELYLNVAEFGPGIYGAEAAARAYFGTSAAALSEEQGAALAAGLPRPERWHPGTSSRAAAKRQAIILRRMEKAQFLRREI